MWLAVGQIVVDRCLIRCHVGSSAAASAAVPACHAAHDDRGAAAWQAAPACDHDHRVASAEATAKVRPDSPVKTSHVLPASSGSARAALAHAAIVREAAPPPGGCTAAAFSRPLRV
jgi:hypothetical protein